MSDTCRRCTSAALVVTPRNDGTELVICSTCGRRFTRVTRSAVATEDKPQWWADVDGGDA